MTSFDDPENVITFMLLHFRALDGIFKTTKPQTLCYQQHSHPGVSGIFYQPKLVVLQYKPLSWMVTGNQVTVRNSDDMASSSTETLSGGSGGPITRVENL